MKPTLSASERAQVAEYLTDYATGTVDEIMLRSLFLDGWQFKGFGRMNSEELIEAVLAQDAADIRAHCGCEGTPTAADTLQWIREQVLFTYNK